MLFRDFWIDSDFETSQQTRWIWQDNRLHYKMRGEITLFFFFPTTVARQRKKKSWFIIKNEHINVSWSHLEIFMPKIHTKNIFCNLKENPALSSVSSNSSNKADPISKLPPLILLAHTDTYIYIYIWLYCMNKCSFTISRQTLGISTNKQQIQVSFPKGPLGVYNTSIRLPRIIADIWTIKYIISNLGIFKLCYCFGSVPATL